MQQLSELLGIQTGARISVVGCGGKTSIINLLAQQNSRRPVLILPTTKILPPGAACTTLCKTPAECQSHTPHSGVQCMGVLNQSTGKLEALPAPDLAAVGQNAGYALVLMEADGSRGLPCKGWLPGEPVVPAFTTLTLGVLPITALGLTATEEHVQRLQQFLALTGLRHGNAITADALAAMAAAPSGMLKCAVGRTALIVNQAQDDDARQKAAELCDRIRLRYPGVIRHFIVGSARQNQWSMV